MCCVQALAELLAEGLDVRLGHRANKIDYEGSGVKVSCDNGTVLDADYVICTVSLGVLKVKNLGSRGPGALVTCAGCAIACVYAECPFAAPPHAMGGTFFLLVLLVWLVLRLPEMVHSGWTGH